VCCGKRTSPISEIELELKSGELRILFDLARQLSQAVPIYLSFTSKFQRGMALMDLQPLHVGVQPPINLARDATVAQAFQAIGRSTLISMATNAEQLRQRPDPDAVHHLRVAARTLRSALATFKAVAADKNFERVKGELGWIAMACNQARNLDVFVEDTLEPAAQLDPPPPGLPALQAAIRCARERAHAEVAQAVASARYRALLIEVSGWVETGDWLSSKPAQGSAQAFAKRPLRAFHKRLLKHGRGLAELGDEARHRVRIDAKKLRYAAEGFQSLFPRQATARFIERLKALQDELGALNDLATAEILLSDLELDAEARFAAGELLGRKAASKNHHITCAAKALDALAETEPFWN
jgi:inorganic triphosphatase YgiF